MEIIYSGHCPKYEEVARVLRKKIESGQYASSGFLPQERDLAAEFAVSRNTMRNALKILSDASLIIKEQGKGTRINHEQNNDICEFIVLSHDATSANANGGTFIVSLLRGIDERAKSAGEIVIYMQFDDSSEKNIMDIAERMKARKNVKGVFLVGRYMRSLLRRMKKYIDLPMVLAGNVFDNDFSRHDEMLVSQVIGDEYNKMYLAVNHFFLKKTKRFLIIGSPAETIWGNSQQNAVRDAFEDIGKGFPVNDYVPLPVHAGNVEGIRLTYDILKKEFSGENAPDALIFPAEYYSALTIFFRDIPETKVELLGITGHPDQYPFDCLLTPPSEFVNQMFDYLESEMKNKSGICQSRVIPPIWQMADKKSRDVSSTNHNNQKLTWDVKHDNAKCK